MNDSTSAVVEVACNVRYALVCVKDLGRRVSIVVRWERGRILRAMTIARGQVKREDESLICKIYICTFSQ